MSEAAATAITATMENKKKLQIDPNIFQKRKNNEQEAEQEATTTTQTATSITLILKTELAIQTLQQMCANPSTTVRITFKSPIQISSPNSTPHRFRRGQYQVDSIKAMILIEGTTLYRVRWCGYEDEKSGTW